MYPYFDTHCDTLAKLYIDKTDISDEKLMINTKTLNLYKPMVQCFALFNDGSLSLDDYFDAARLMKKICGKNGITMCRTAEDIAFVKRNGGKGALLTIEGLGNTGGLAVGDIQKLKKAGYAMAGLVWNFDNPICGGCMGKNVGLTQFGRQIAEMMNRVGMIIDVSHMSDKSFYDISAFCKPIVASHSNCRAICNHCRNLDDDMIRKISVGGGVIGVNFYPPFLSEEKADISTIVKHIDRIIAIGGESCVCIGSDFDGTDFSVDGIKGAADVSKLFSALEGKNYSKTIINDICFNNVYNLFGKYEISH